jgi:hypothetical protein
MEGDLQTILEIHRWQKGGRLVDCYASMRVLGNAKPLNHFMFLKFIDSLEIHILIIHDSCQLEFWKKYHIE